MMPTPYRVTQTFWDHATLWDTGDESMAGHSTDGGRVFGITRTRYVECDHYKCQPVAVVAYEDREAVERLVCALENLTGHAYGLVALHMQAALREFANPKPPKPDEPTGLGAVVEATAYTSEIRVFVRTAAKVSPWHDADGNGHMWSELVDPEVLSEGVTP